jgi:predicted transport protein
VNTDIHLLNHTTPFLVKLKIRKTTCMKTANETEKEFLEGLEENYGQSLVKWMEVIRNAKLSKQTEILKWLKSEKGFKHMDAWMLAAIYMNHGKPVYGSENELLENQLMKNENMRPLFNFVSEQILRAVDGSSREVKKTYISFKKKREFAAVNIKRGEIRLGMDLGKQPFDDILEKAKMTGPMPRISHMVVLKDKTDFTKNLIGLLQKSNERVNI